MRYIKGQKAQTKQNIMRSACKLFAAKGFAATSIDAIMHDCNLTRGGFYAHFNSKRQLYRDAIELATSHNDCTSAVPMPRPPSDWIEVLLNEYLTNTSNDISHLAFLATDVASAVPEVRTAYTNAFNAINKRIAARISQHLLCSETTALSLTAMIIGALAIGRTVDDKKLSTELFAACKENARAMLLSVNEQPLSFFWEAPVERPGRFKQAHN